MRGTRHSGDNEAGLPVPADDVPVDKRSRRGEDADCRQAVQPRRPAIEGRRRPYGARGPVPGDVARHLGVSSAAVVYNWARSREKEAAPMRDEPAKASGDEPAWSGFDGSPEDRIRQLELENDILRGVVEVLKAARPRALTNGEKTLIEHLRRTTDHSLKSSRIP